jgi:hypothetical protein
MSSEKTAAILKPGVDAEISSASTPRAVAELPMSEQQLELHQLLLGHSEEAANWYYGAVFARSQSGNPERLIQAAHSMRELMWKLHVFIEVPAEGDPARPFDKLSALADIWESAKKKTRCQKEGAWNDKPIDKHLRRALAAADKTVDWVRTNRPHFQETSKRVIEKLDVSSKPLPPAVENRHYLEWSSLYEYFKKVCHHERQTDEVEFDANFYAFERFVLDRAKPKISEEHKRLDELIAEAEHGD